MIVVIDRMSPLPDRWDASVYLGPAEGPAHPGGLPPDRAGTWHADAVALLRRRWRGTGRLVVFLGGGAGQAGDRPGTDELAWAEDRLRQSDVLLFWAPVPAPSGPAAHEWSRWVGSGRLVLGAPAGAAHAAALRRDAEHQRVAVAGTLPEAIDAVLALVGQGASRQGVHTEVPLPLWRTPSFQHWLVAQTGAGNRIERARLMWSLPSSADAGTFLWVLHPHVHIGAENRIKDNEVVIGRSDVVTVVAYTPAADLGSTRVVLVREFRSPVVTSDGYVHELPGGSDPHAASPLDTAVVELAEETGLRVAPGRVRRHGARQAVATLLAHRQHVFSVELTAAEMDGLSLTTEVFGLAADGERTTVEVSTYRQILAARTVDWSTLGVLSSVLTEVLTEAPGRPVTGTPPSGTAAR